MLSKNSEGKINHLRDGATKLGHNYHTRAHKQANVLNILEIYYFQYFFIYAKTRVMGKGGRNTELIIGKYILIYINKLCSPDDTLVGRVHGRAKWTAPVLSKLSHVGESAVCSEPEYKILFRKGTDMKDVIYGDLSGEWGSVRIWFLRWGGLTASHLKNKQE